MIVTFAFVLLLTVPYARRLPRPPRPPQPRPAPVDEAMVVDLVAALLSSGAAIPTALESLGRSLPAGAEANEATVAGRSLLLGAPWEEAWEDATRLKRMASALEPAWVDGAPPVDLLKRCAAAIRARRMSKAQEAAAKLGVRLVLPLGLCFLPAFFLIGVLPVIAALGLRFFGS